MYVSVQSAITRQGAQKLVVQDDRLGLDLK
jgi:hypothetical protein